MYWVGVWSVVIKSLRVIQDVNVKTMKSISTVHYAAPSEIRQRSIVTPLLTLFSSSHYKTAVS